jgi:hypothetical protein
MVMAAMAMAMANMMTTKTTKTRMAKAKTAKEKITKEKIVKTETAKEKIVKARITKEKIVKAKITKERTMEMKTGIVTRTLLTLSPCPYPMWTLLLSVQTAIWLCSRHLPSSSVFFLSTSKSLYFLPALQQTTRRGRC